MDGGAAAPVRLPLDDVSVWKAMSGSSIDIPTEGSIVHYLPYLHAANLCGGSFADNKLNLPPHIIARVTALHLRTNGDDVFVEFHLDRLDESAVNGIRIEEGRSEIGGINSREVQVFTHLLSPMDVDQSICLCILDKRFAETMFPPLPNGGTQVVSFIDLARNSIKLEHKHSDAGIDVFFGPTWLQFLQAKKPAAGELLVVTKNMESNEYRVGIRRQKVQCSETTARRILNQVGEEINLSNQFRVLYYPRESAGEFVLLHDAFLAATPIRRWREGMTVSFTVEDDRARLLTRNGIIRRVRPLGCLLTVVDCLNSKLVVEVPAWKVLPHLSLIN